MRLHPIRTTTSTLINVVFWRYRVEQRKASTVTKQFKRTFDEAALNELGRAARFCHRKRTITPYRLALSLVEAFATKSVASIADIQRAFNALCDTDVQYKPFHNQLAKRQFPEFTRRLFERLLTDLASVTLRFDDASPFSMFNQISLQDGTSFALKPALAKAFPGRFTSTSPAAVELHANLDLFTESLNQVVLSPDSAAEAQFLPPAEALSGSLLLGDRGYFAKGYLCALNQAGAYFIVRGTASMNPVILRAIRPDGTEVASYRGKRLKEIAKHISRYEFLDLDVRYTLGREHFDCRLLASPNPKEGRPRYLASNLDRALFNPEQLSDGYRLRWQIELLFKEWKSHANLHAFDTANPAIAEGLIWAALCAAAVKRYCAHMTQRLAEISISTQKVAMCIHHVLPDVIRAVMHKPRQLYASIERAINYLSSNARRAHPQRDCLTGRLKLGLVPVFGDC